MKKNNNLCISTSKIIIIILFLTVYGCSIDNESYLSSQYPVESQRYDEIYPAIKTLSFETNLFELYCSVKLPIPDNELASLGGLIYQIGQHTVLSDMLIYLTPAQGIDNSPPPILAGPIREKGDVIGKTNNAGCFYMGNIPPDDYYLVVYLGFDYDIVVNSIEDSTPKLISIKPNQQLYLGTIVIP